MIRMSRIDVIAVFATQELAEFALDVAKLVTDRLFVIREEKVIALTETGKE
jgi:hypothetical protein